MKTGEAAAALRARFCGPEWALFFEVGDATGGRQRRWADAVVMNLYPSRGLEIHGFEIKVSRGDWLRELKNPEKSAPVQRYCDRWWILCPAATIAPGELPPTWGHYELKPGGKIQQIVAAPKLTSQPVTRDFVAAMLRRASEIDESAVNVAAHNEVERLRASDEKRIEREIEMRTRHAKELQESVNEVERISGVKISNWNSPDVGRAVKAVMAAGVTGTYGNLDGLRRQAENILKNCDEALAIFAISDVDATEEAK